MSMIDRVFLFFLSKYHMKNCNFIIKMFLDNDYPIKFIFDTINLRLKSLLKCKTLKQIDKSNNNEIEDKKSLGLLYLFYRIIYMTLL